ncbi:hypothetical protein FHETE_8189 [Fusarium heterosporum]|uniref:Uncharacterized protein n=1 Tax=Fusarium heterosporum TaxID=42747 RepID=A0A8H5WL51_FUSHE|nr:hypothetical protein FHETE_8189 [Fusarium heterosporum]
MFFVRNSNGNPWFYRHISSNLPLHFILNMYPPAVEAVDELWQDWYSRQPYNCPMVPNHEYVALVIRLMARDPDRFSYHKPNPDKTNWREISHLVRYCLRILVILGPVFRNRDTRLEVKIVLALHHASLNIKWHCSERWLQQRQNRIEASRPHGNGRDD